MPAAAVLYASNPVRVVPFYVAVCGMSVDQEEPDFTVLTSADWELVVLQIPFEVVVTGEVREETPIKLAFSVPSIAAARAVARDLGGAVKDGGWPWRGQLVCDGHDPEGNVVQLREPYPSASVHP